MMKNPFFSVEPHRGKTPRSVFALFDQRSEESIYLETVDADWFSDSSRNLSGLRDWADASDYAPLNVLEVPSQSAAGLQILGGRENDPEGDDGGPATWLEIELDPYGDNALIYHSLFGQADPVGVGRVAPASAKAAAYLDQAFSLTGHVTTRSEIERVLMRRLPTIEWIGVYDVGQGSANGLCDRDGAPRIYFDLGGGVLGNATTFPAAFGDICLTYEPPVILSHWDWDHWSSAARFPRAQTLNWVVPDQKLGAVHATMAGSIAVNGALLVWPAGLPGLSVRQVTVEKCTGTSGRNNTGLAVLVDGPNGEKPILLTGDARYTAIPSGFADVMSIVIAHHGADMRSKATPACPGHPASRVAYSYGPGNTFAHPRARTYTNHEANGWQHRATNPVGAVDRHTPDRRPYVGNIGLDWTGTATPPTQPCGGRCSLQLF
jgi:hypothetical protein